MWATVSLIVVCKVTGMTLKSRDSGQVVRILSVALDRQWFCRRGCKCQIPPEFLSVMHPRTNGCMCDRLSRCFCERACSCGSIDQVLRIWTPPKRKEADRWCWRNGSVFSRISGNRIGLYRGPCHHGFCVSAVPIATSDRRVVVRAD